MLMMQTRNNITITRIELKLCNRCVSWFHFFRDCLDSLFAACDKPLMILIIEQCMPHRIIVYFFSLSTSPYPLLMRWRCIYYHPHDCLSQILCRNQISFISKAHRSSLQCVIVHACLESTHGLNHEKDEEDQEDEDDDDDARRAAESWKVARQTTHHRRQHITVPVNHHRTPIGERSCEITPPPPPPPPPAQEKETIKTNKVQTVTTIRVTTIITITHITQ